MNEKAGSSVAHYCCGKETSSCLIQSNNLILITSYCMNIHYTELQDHRQGKIFMSPHSGWIKDCSNYILHSTLGLYNRGRNTLCPICAHIRNIIAWNHSWCTVSRINYCSFHGNPSNRKEYTPWAIKKCKFYFWDNSGKYGPILIILSPLQSVMNCKVKLFHLSLNLLLHYLAKFKCSKYIPL